MKEKQKLYDHCSTYVQERITRIQEEINRAQSSANEETKSSVGDKYETSRAMAQLEVERNTVQLREAEKLQAIMQSLPADSVASGIAGPGSLVNTSKGVFYIAISVGVVTLGQNQYFVVSSDSPIGKLLIGKRSGDSITWKGFSYEIEKVQ